MLAVDQVAINKNRMVRLMDELQERTPSPLGLNTNALVWTDHGTSLTLGRHY